MSRLSVMIRSRVLPLAVWRAWRQAHRAGSPGLLARLRVLPAMVADVVTGRWSGVSRGRLLAMVAAVAYVVSPVDLVPEAAMLLLGLTDDLLVLTWLVAAVVEATDRYLLDRQPDLVVVTVPHQMRTRSSGANHSPSPSVTP
jgi:uncharacterized membrane protein YkvA (DUF1232 family)